MLKILCKLTIILALVILIPALIFAENSKLDSLKNTLNHQKDDTNKVKILYKIGWELKTSNPSESYKYAENSLKLSKEIGFKQGEADAYKEIGVINFFQANYSVSLENYFKSLEINEFLHNLDGQSRNLGNIGNIYNRQEKYDEALRYNKKALEINKKLADTDLIANSYGNIANIYVNKKDFPKALEYYKQALELSIALNDKESIARHYSNIGNSYLLQNQLTMALDYYSTSLTIYRKIDEKNGISHNLIAIGEIENRLSQYKEAIKSLEEGLKIANEIGNKAQLKDVYRILSDTYFKSNDINNAYHFQKLFAEIKDSLFNEESTKKQTQAELGYLFDKKQQKFLLEQKRKEEISNLIRNGLIIGIILILIIAIVIYRSYNDKQKANKLLEEQKLEIEEQNTKIKDSINYAQKIQEAILPSLDKIESAFSDFFVLYKPRDIVSGDFYWFAEKNDKIIIAAVDCTGHGVPGAFMSMVGDAILAQIVIENGVIESDKILNEMHKRVRTALKQDVNSSRDGMDISICVIDKFNKVLEFSGANNPLYYFIDNSNELLEIKGDRKSIGGSQKEDERVFTKNIIKYSSSLKFYIFSDGYCDQFGGSDGKKFMSKGLKLLLIQSQDSDMNLQRANLDQKITNWMGNDYEQMDDILVIGVRV